MIEVFKNTDKTVTVTLPASLSAATDVKLYVHSKGSLYIGENECDIINGLTGSTINGVTIFNISNTYNNIDEYVYIYNVVAVKDLKKYVISSGSYTVLPSLIIS